MANAKMSTKDRYMRNEIIEDIYEPYLGYLEKSVTKHKQMQNGFIDDIESYVNELNNVKNNKNDFIDKIMEIAKIEIKPKISLKRIKKIVDYLKYNFNSNNLLSKIYSDPFKFITIENVFITIDQAYAISKKYKTLKNITYELLVEKFAISAIREYSNSSFYLVKRNKQFNITKGWYEMLEIFCEDKKLNYDILEGILDNIIVPHQSNNEYFTLTQFIDIEKKMGDHVLTMFYQNEENVDDNLQSKVDDYISNFENSNNIIFEDEQKNSIKNIVNNRLSIVYGPPGTGKTTITKCCIDFLQEENKNYNICLMAPTGKALKCLLKSCNNIKHKKICGTIHKCVFNVFKKFKEKDESDDNKFNNYAFENEKKGKITKFMKKKKDNDFPTHINHIIIDESSMIDIFMFKKILFWCDYFKCNLTMLGDVFQLPPVGIGRPFEDIIYSEYFECVKLTKIKRQDNGSLKTSIVNLLDKKMTMNDFDYITDSQKVSMETLENSSTVFIEHEFHSEKETTDICGKLINMFQRKMDDLCFITPQNREIGGVENINRMLQTNIYNQHENDFWGNFRNNDYIIRTENDYKDDDVYINGDTCRMTVIGRDKIKINYDDGRSEMVDKRTLSESFMLNYSNTVHKYQGSQCENVVFILSPFHKSMYYSPQRLKLAYTAISRAKKRVIILGDKNILPQIQKHAKDIYISSFMKVFDEYEESSEDEEDASVGEVI
jgi:DNA polymerase III delta prime subunit